MLFFLFWIYFCITCLIFTFLDDFKVQHFTCMLCYLFLIFCFWAFKTGILSSWLGYLVLPLRMQNWCGSDIFTPKWTWMTEYPVSVPLTITIVTNAFWWLEGSDDSSNPELFLLPDRPSVWYRSCKIRGGTVPYNSLIVRFLTCTVAGWMQNIPSVANKNDDKGSELRTAFILHVKLNAGGNII